jgi:hypothetical protein
MSNGRNLRGRGKTDPHRDSGGFVALPWSVLDSPAFAALSHPAKALLLEFARQYVRDNNGRLLASMRHLSKRGWRSADVVTRAKRELIEAGFVHETVKGRRPNRASWYAVTWYSLDAHRDYDEGAAESFERGAYRSTTRHKNARLKPAHGAGTRPIAPEDGIVVVGAVPRTGAVACKDAASAMPHDGDHLDMPSPTGEGQPQARVLH